MAAFRVVVTGGPGGGKTTVWREFVKRHGERVVGVPEVATALLTELFPNVQNAAERCALQRAIFSVQREVEAVHEQRCGAAQLLLCDRGTPDGAGYWPHGSDAFFESLGTRGELELARYDAVLFLETAAAGGLSISAGNAVRSENRASAVEVDRRLHAIWSGHPGFVHVPLAADFQLKVDRALAVLEGFLQR